MIASFEARRLDIARHLAVQLGRPWGDLTVEERDMLMMMANNAVIEAEEKVKHE